MGRGDNRLGRMLEEKILGRSIVEQGVLEERYMSRNTKPMSRRIKAHIPLVMGAHSIRKNQKIEPIRPIRVGLGWFMEATDWVRFQILKI